MTVRGLALSLISASVLLFAGCEAGREVQSALYPAGPAAAKLAWLWWAMFYICGTVFVLVMMVLCIALLRRSKTPGVSPVGNKFIVVSGIVLPAIVLVVLLFLNLETSSALRRLPVPEVDNPLTIRVIGHQWWWEVEYPEQGIITANEFYIPVGESVRLDLFSADVIHSFWVPQLHGKMDMLPDHETTLWIKADQPGKYRGQCAEFCGLQHARMAFYVVALEPAEFQSWVDDRLRPVPEPATDLTRRGMEVFFEANCHNCHAIRDTRAYGRRGPDLTHMGTRLTVGAGQMPNGTGNLAGWLANPQALKPGNPMPATYLRSQDLHALVAYLESLE